MPLAATMTLACTLSSARLARHRRVNFQAMLDQVRATGQWAASHPQDIAALIGPLTGLPPDIVATWQSRTRYGAVPVTADIVANQQRVADLFYQQKLIPKPVNVAGSVWLWKPAKP